LTRSERPRRNEPSLHPLTEADVSAAARLLTLAYPHRSDEPTSWSRRPEAPDRWRWLFKSPDGVVHAYGWPDPDPPPDGISRPPESVEQFRSRSHEFGMVPESCFIAVLGEEYIGYSSLNVNDKSRTRAGSAGTAVRPEHRGLGIATALKARCIGWAQTNGFRRLATSSGNAAMVRVNEKFGFRRTYIEVRLVKRLGSDP
jgi:RimJ/RimL family protein N-acetyltransferase